MLNVANSRSLRPLSLVSTVDIAVGSTNVSPVCQRILPNSLVQPEYPSLVFGIWFPRIAGGSGKPYCHPVQLLMHRPVYDGGVERSFSQVARDQSAGDWSAS